MRACCFKNSPSITPTPGRNKTLKNNRAIQAEPRVEGNTKPDVSKHQSPDVEYGRSRGLRAVKPTPLNGSAQATLPGTPNRIDVQAEIDRVRKGAAP